MTEPLTSEFVREKPLNLLIRGGRVVDPSVGVDAIRDVWVKDGLIQRVGEKLDVPEGATLMEAQGLIVAPGLVDMHVHLREPGGEGSETIESGTRAAAAGGVTSVLAMPNTHPPVDNVSGVRFVLRRAFESGHVRVWPSGAITQGRAGEALAEIGSMVEAGCVAFTDDGDSVPSSGLLRRALEYAKVFDALVIEHSEDRSLMNGGVMNEGALATRLGLKGIPRQAESIAVARNIALAELTGARLHLAHVSTKASVDLLRSAISRGLPVSGEVTPHHLFLTEEAILTWGTHAKMNPPLRSEEDRQAVLEALREGVLGVIATDHAPHSRSAKEQEFAAAPFGIIGLETLLPLVVTHLVLPGLLSWTEALRRLSTTPAQLLKIPVGQLKVGTWADLIVIDYTREKSVGPFQSRSRNSPFMGQKLRGFSTLTLVGGRRVWREEGL